MIVDLLGELVPGVERRGVALTLSLGRVRAFSGGLFGEAGWPHRNLHTDDAAARAAGLPAIIVSGTQSEGHLVEFLIETFGEGWLENGELTIRLPRSAHVGDTVTPVARVTGRTGDGAHLVILLDVRVENQHGAAVLEGTARFGHHPTASAGAVD